jgi:hypothetical protein
MHESNQELDYKHAASEIHCDFKYIEPGSEPMQ